MVYLYYVQLHGKLISIWEADLDQYDTTYILSHLILAAYYSWLLRKYISLVNVFALYRLVQDLLATTDEELYLLTLTPHFGSGRRSWLLYLYLCFTVGSDKKAQFWEAGSFSLSFESGFMQSRVTKEFNTELSITTIRPFGNRPDLITAFKIKLRNSARI